MIMSKSIVAGHMYDLEMSKDMYRGLSIFFIEKIVKNEIHQDYLILFQSFSGLISSIAI